MNGVTFGLGERSIRSKEVALKARQFLSPKYKIKSQHVSIDYTGQNSRISGYQVWVEVENCSGETVLYYDAAMVLKSVDDKLKC